MIMNPGLILLKLSACTVHSFYFNFGRIQPEIAAFSQNLMTYTHVDEMEETLQGVNVAKVQLTFIVEKSNQT